MAELESRRATIVCPARAGEEDEVIVGGATGVELSQLLRRLAKGDQKQWDVFAMVMSAPWDTNGLAVEWTASSFKWLDEVPGGAVHLEDPPRDAVARQKKFEMPMSRNEIDGTLAALRVVNTSKPDEELAPQRDARWTR